MATDVWGYIHIEAASIPERLTQGPYEDRGWTEYPDQQGYWLPCGEEPDAHELDALQTAQAEHEIDGYRIVHPMPVA